MSGLRAERQERSRSPRRLARRASDTVDAHAVTGVDLLLHLQRTAGNRAVNALLAQQRPIAGATAVQRYIQLDDTADNARDRVSTNFRGVGTGKAKLADDGTALVTEEAHRFFATEGVIAHAAERLQATQSAVTLVPNGQDRVEPNGQRGGLLPQAQPLVRADPQRSHAHQGETGIKQHAVKHGGPGFATHGREELCLAFPNSCRMTARAILAGNPRSATQGVFTPGGGATTTPHGASDNDAEWPRFGREVRQTLVGDLFRIGQIAEDEQGRILRLQGDARDEAIGAVYLALDAQARAAFDALAGINASADARIGQAFIGMHDYDLQSQHEREHMPVDSPRAHWAAVVAEAGSDRVTLEGTRNSAIGGPRDSVHNRLWNFNMYGTRANVPEQTFNAKWGGAKKTTMVVRGSAAQVAEGVLDPARSRREREAQQAAQALRGRVTAEMIQEVREFVGGAAHVSNEQIIEALVAANLDTMDAACRLPSQ